MHNEDERLFGILFTDVLFQFLAYLFIILALYSVLPHKTTDESLYLGKVCAELYWDNDKDIDLDLWGKSPLDSKGIGYTNMHGAGLDLFKDTLGFINNPEHINIEIMCANKLYPGTWTFNVHYYLNHESKHDGSPWDYKIEAKMVIRVTGKNNVVKTMRTSWMLTHEGEEKTMFNFLIKEDGTVDEKSINSVNIPIRNTTSGSNG